MGKNKSNETWLSDIEEFAKMTPTERTKKVDSVAYTIAAIFIVALVLGLLF